MSNRRVISAEAILKSRSGRSLATATEPITSANLDAYSPTPATIAEATQHLEVLGFKVVASGITLTLEGEAALFESVFQVQIELAPAPRAGEFSFHPLGEVVIPETLQALVETIVFPEPPEFYP